MAYTLQTPSQLQSHLRALRQARAWTQAELGARLGLSQARIARIEGAPLSVSVQQLLEVLAALGVRLTLEPVSAPATVTKSATTPSPARGAKPQRKQQAQTDW